jgi:hypothetical protein
MTLKIDFRILMVFLCCLFLGLLYLEPQIMHQNDGLKGSVILYESEYVEAAQLSRILEGDPHCAPYIMPSSENCTRPTPLAISYLAIWGKIFDLTLDQLIILSRGAFINFAFFFLVLSLGHLGLRFSYALFASLITFISPASWFLKPFMGPILGFYQFNFNSFATPLFGIAIIMITLFSLARDLDKSRSWRGQSFTGGIFAGICTLLSPMMTLFFALFVTLRAIVRRDKKSISAVGFFSLGLSLGLVWPMMSGGISPLEVIGKLSAFPWREHHSLLLIWILAPLFIKRYRSQEQMLWLAFISITFVHILSHYLKPLYGLDTRYILVPISLGVMALLVQKFLEWIRDIHPPFATIKVNYTTKTSLFVLVVLMLFGLGQYNLFRFYNDAKSLESSRSVGSLAPVFKWLQEKYPDPVTLAGPYKFSRALPLHTRHYGLVDFGNPKADPAPNELQDFLFTESVEVELDPLKMRKIIDSLRLAAIVESPARKLSKRALDFLRLTLVAEIANHRIYELLPGDNLPPSP